MALLSDILTWTTNSLTPWQGDAVRRLFQKQNLDAQDIDDLYAMLKTAHGIADPHNRQPVPLAQQHLPVQAGTTTPVTLAAMRDLTNVNRIAPSQKLDFSPTGITVIYGGNGSGKSGYSRVLKRACRARDITETIHPDAFDPKATARVPEATFEIEVAGKTTSLHWTRDTTPPDQLSAIAVFDSRCARSYLDAEQDAAYLPYGLDIVENLGQRVLPELSTRLNAEIEATNTDATPFADLAGDTTVGKAIASLSASSDPQEIDALATLTTGEMARFAELDKTLAENDPTAKAKAMRLSAQRISGLVVRIGSAISIVDDASAGKLKDCDGEAETAAKAELIAAQNFREGEKLLPGTGDLLWKSLLEAARRFSTECAYKDSSFPHVEAGAQCPLCQQPLAQTAADRLKRFDAFVKQDTAKVATEKREFRQRVQQKLTVASLDFGIDAPTEEEITQIQASLPEAIRAFGKQLEQRKAYLLEAFKTHIWKDAPPIDADPRPILAGLASRLTTDATDLDKASDVIQRKLLEVERAELRARSNLSGRKKPVLELIQRMRIKAALTKCKNDLKTKPISDKAKDFASQAVTVALEKALNAEFVALGVGHIKTKLHERAEQGKMKLKLILDLPVTRKLDEILSEGEQRAIAIGSFLAEMHLADHKGGIVFDDPVSSLDHHWRRNVAQRLVKEAKSRQVIILTHDTSFLGDLRDAIEQQNVTCLMHHLDWANNQPGHVCPGLPWEHQSYKERIDEHEKRQRTLSKNWPVYPGDADREAMRREYGLLRATIERVIQDVVFNGVVKRYRDWIRVDSLEDVVGFASTEHEEIARLHKACCDVTTAHDPSSAKSASVPDPAQLGTDIASLKTVIDGIKTRRKNSKAKAKTVAIAPSP